MIRKPLTGKQSRFLKDLIAYVRREKRPPTFRELQDITGLKSPRSIGQYLGALENAGYIKRGEGSRNVRILRPATSLQSDGVTTVHVPIVGSAPCGVPVLAEQNIEGYISVSMTLAKPPSHYFILKANGDSMNEAGINNGDMVLIRQQTIAEDGQIVVALVDNEATIKRLRISKGYITLEPNSRNSEHHLIIVERDFQVQGVVVKTL